MRYKAVMRNHRMPLYAAAALLAALCACSSGAGKNTGVSDSITIAGSTALLPLVKQAAVDYQTLHPGVKISVSGGGSMTGITQAAEKAVDIGDSDIPPIDQPELVQHRIAVVYFAVIVNPAAHVRNLTVKQIRGIFSGRITNWRDAGGADQQIAIINRPVSSGTRAVFVDKILGGAQPAPGGLTQDSSGTVASMVAQVPGAASYIAMAYVHPDEQTAVSIDGAAPTQKNVIDGKYPYWSYEYMLTNGQPGAPVAAFIDYVKNDDRLLADVHFLPVRAMKKR